MGRVCAVLAFLGYFAVSASVSAEIVERNSYSFPLYDNLRTTIGTVLIPDADWRDYQDHYLKVLPTKKKVIGGFDYNDNRAKTYFRHYPAKNGSRRLVFLISGLGGDAKSNIDGFLATQIQRSGASVVVLPNPIQERFAYASSRHGYVGYVPEDATAVYRNIVKIMRFLQRRHNIDYTPVKLMGYSMGALYAAHVMKIDREQGYNFIRGGVLVNTPIDLHHGMQTLDAFYDPEKNGNFIVDIVLKGLGVIGSYLENSGKTDFSAFADFMESLNIFDVADKRAIIGWYLRGSMAKLILASQNIHDMGVLPKFYGVGNELEGNSSNMSKRLGAAEKFGFVAYARQFIVPFYRNVLGHSDLTYEEMNKRSSLFALESFLRAEKSVHLFHNQDDFLMQPGDAIYLESIFRERARIYPHGGHLGNIWHEPVIRLILQRLN